MMMATHDRIHAREPAYHRDRWAVWTIESINQRDGHCVVTVTKRARRSNPSSHSLFETFLPGG